ncbi:hypothetical protein D9M72_596330 [compost metagenome]
MTRIPSLAYSMAIFFEIALMPPLVSIATEAFMPAIGRSASGVVMLTMLPPLFCASICLTTSWVVWRKPSIFVALSWR